MYVGPQPVGIPLSPPLFGGNCLQPVIWLGKTLDADSDDKNTYSATVPTPSNGAWTGYYIEIFFDSTTGLKHDYQFCTPGQVWPNTLPFPDCHGKACKGTLL